MIGIGGAEAVYPPSYGCEAALGVGVGGGFRVREAQRMYTVQDGSGFTYLL